MSPFPFFVTLRRSITVTVNVLSFQAALKRIDHQTKKAWINLNSNFTGTFLDNSFGFAVYRFGVNLPNGLVSVNTD
jgi:hypothetical protein